MGSGMSASYSDGIGKGNVTIAFVGTASLSGDIDYILATNFRLLYNY